MKVLGRIGVGAIIGCVVAVISGVSIFILATGPVPSQFGLEAGLLIMALVVIALVGGLIVGAVASGVALVFFKGNPSKTLWISAAAGLLIAPVSIYFASILSPSCQSCQTLSGHTNSVQAVAFSPDGKFLVSAGEDRTVIIRETANLRKILKKLTGHGDWITDLAFSADGKMLVSADWSGGIYVWDTENLKEPINIYHEKEGLADVEISPDGEYIIAASIYPPENLTFWPLTSEEYQRFSVQGLRHIAFDPNGNRIVAAGNTTKFYSFQDLRQQTESICCAFPKLEEIAFGPDGKMAAVRSDDVYLWTSLEPGSEPITFHPETEGNIMSLAMSSDGKYLAIGRNRIFIWDLLNLDLPPITLEGIGYVYSLSFDPNNDYLAVGGPQPQIFIYDLNEFR